MIVDESSVTPLKKFRQPSSYGAPRRQMDTRFYRIAKGWISSFNMYLTVLAILMAFIALGLLAYVGLAINHTNIYVSDGGDFSCKLNHVQESKK